MLSFPLLYLAAPFAILFLIWLIFAFFAFYHIAKFGHLNHATYYATVIFLGLSAIILYFSYSFLATVNWNYLVEINFQLY